MCLAFGMAARIDSLTPVKWYYSHENHSSNNVKGEREKGNHREARRLSGWLSCFAYCAHFAWFSFCKGFGASGTAECGDAREEELVLQPPGFCGARRVGGEGQGPLLDSAACFWHRWLQLLEAFQVVTRDKLKTLPPKHTIRALLQPGDAGEPRWRWWLVISPSGTE